MKQRPELNQLSCSSCSFSLCSWRRSSAARVPPRPAVMKCSARWRRLFSPQPGDERPADQAECGVIKTYKLTAPPPFSLSHEEISARVSREERRLTKRGGRSASNPEPREEDGGVDETGGGLSSVLTPQEAPKHRKQHSLSIFMPTGKFGKFENQRVNFCYLAQRNLDPV